MSRFRCERFPTGAAKVRTTAGFVDFVDGSAVVEDAELAAALRQVPEVFGIVEEGAAGSVASAARPAARRRRPRQPRPPAEGA